MKAIIILLFLSVTIAPAISQGVSINEDGSEPDASAMLDVSSTDKGMLVPRLSTAQWISIASPAEGLLVYVTDSTAFYYYDGSTWGKIANQFQLGGPSDYAEFEYDGTLVFNGESTTYEDLQIPGFTVARRGINDPDLNVFIGSISAYGFDRGTDEEVFFSVQIPHSWKEGSTIYPHIHYSVENTSTNDSIVWAMDYSWASVNESFPTTATTVSVTAWAGTPYDHQVIGFDGISPNASQGKISSIMLCRLYRDADNAADTYNSDAIFLQFDIHYEVNTMGSRLEWVK